MIKNNIKNRPEISVVMITYNHEKYIEDAIRGVFQQDFNFNIELIISNDNSTDDTHLVIQNYLSENDIPDNIDVKYYKHKENKGAIPNFKWTIDQAKGKYVAICEGDDYWTEPLKLQKQVDFLEANYQFSACFTNINMLIEDKLKTGVLKQKHKKNHDLYSLQIDQWIPTLTIVFRNKDISDMSSNILKVLNGDVFLFHHLANKGTIGYLDFISGIYRIQNQGIWSSLNEIKKINSRKNTLKVLKKSFKDKKLKTLINENLKKNRQTKLKIYFKKYKSSKLVQFFKPLFK